MRQAGGTVLGLIGLVLGLSLPYRLQVGIAENGWAEEGSMLRLIQDWRWVLGSAAIGLLGVLLSTLAHWRNRWDFAPTAFWIIAFSILIGGYGSASRSDQISVWEITVPGVVTGLVTCFLLMLGQRPAANHAAEEPRDLQPMGPPPDADSEGSLRLRYLSTLEQAVDDHMTLHYPADTLFRLRLYQVVQGGIPYLIAFLLFQDHPQRLVLAGFAAILFVCFLWIRLVPRLRAGLRSSIAGTYVTFPEEVEWVCDDHSILFRRSSIETRMPWSNLDAVESGAFGLRLTFRGSGPGIIPERAFPNPKERRRWEERIEQFLPENRTS